MHFPSQKVRSYLACTFVAIPLVACSSSEEDGSTESLPTPAIGKATTHFNAKWKSDTVVLEADQLASLLIERWSEDGSYRFRSSAELSKQLTVGKPLFMSGVNLVRITKVDSTANELTIQTEPISLAEAAEEAHLDFRLEDVLPTLTGAETSASLNGNSIRPQGASNITPDGKSASYEGNIGDFALSYKYTRAPNLVNAEVAVTYGNDKEGKFKVVGIAGLTPFNAEGNLDVAGGSTRDFKLALDGMDISFEFDGGFISTGKGGQILKVPTRVRVPFTASGLPLYLEIGAEIEIESQLGPQTSVFFRTKCHAKSKSSLHYDGTTMHPLGTIDSVECEVIPNDYLGATINGGVAVRVDLPKIALGVGLPSPTPNIRFFDKIRKYEPKLEGFVAFKHEVVGNVAIQHEAVGNFPVIAGTCYTLDYNEGIFAGGEFGIAKFALKTEHQLAGKHIAHKEIGTGKGCPK